MGAVAVIGTLDTKGRELEYLRDRLGDAGVDTILIDVGVLGSPSTRADIPRDEVARAAGVDLDRLVVRADRGEAVTAMARGASALVKRLHDEGRINGVVALGGSAGASIAAAAMRALPLGVPKLIVSTVFSGDTRAYVGATDITMMYPVVDIAGLNAISTRIIANAAGAIAGMLAVEPVIDGQSRPLLAATMFGVTTPCVTRAQTRLEERGYEVMVFHATGPGGDSMEALARDGSFKAVLDITTTELADELAGGICAAGPGRLRLELRPGVPRVVSLGALDMVNFAAMDTVPERYRDRLLYQHNPAVTLMRTNVEECAALGRRLAERLNGAIAPVALMVPRLGLSAIDAEGQPFYAPDADEALFDALLSDIGPGVDVHDLPLHINSPEFADAAAALTYRYASSR